MFLALNRISKCVHFDIINSLKLVGRIIIRRILYCTFYLDRILLKKLFCNDTDAQAGRGK